MKMRNSLWLGFGAVLALSACGSSSDTKTFEIKSAFPAASASGGWIEDPDALDFYSQTNPAGVSVATTNAQATAMIDGDADPFTSRGFVAMGDEFYKNTIGGTPATLELRVWQMPSTTVATSVYDAMASTYTWTAASFGDAGRSRDTGVSWYYQVRKGVYFVDLRDLRPNTSAAIKTSGETFLAAVVALLP
jgi:hypothetical protein